MGAGSSSRNGKSQIVPAEAEEGKGLELVRSDDNKVNPVNSTKNSNTFANKLRRLTIGSDAEEKFRPANYLPDKFVESPEKNREKDLSAASSLEPMKMDFISKLKQREEMIEEVSHGIVLNVPTKALKVRCSATLCDINFKKEMETLQTKTFPALSKLGQFLFVINDFFVFLARFIHLDIY